MYVSVSPSGGILVCHDCYSDKSGIPIIGIQSLFPGTVVAVRYVQEQEHENQRRFHRLEEMLTGLTGLVERFTSSDKHTTDSASVAKDGGNAAGNDSGCSGEDAYGWTNRLERYFWLKEVNEEEKMRVVIVALEGKTLNWFQWWETCYPNPTWETFKEAVVQRFQPTMLQNPFEVLIGLKQIGQVGKYIEQFELYAGFFKGMRHDYLIGIFLNRLKDDIRAEVKLYEPKSLDELMIKALMVEDKIQITSPRGSLVVQRSHTTFRPLSQSRSHSLEGGSAAVFSNSARGGGEGNSFVSTVLDSNKSEHPSRSYLMKSCKIGLKKALFLVNKQLHMLLVSDEDIKDLEGGKEIIPLPAEEGEDTTQILQLSQCAMAGLTTKKSWKLWGMIGNEKVVILIDCGASHNFISTELISKCGLQQQTTLPYMVEVGDGHKVHCQGKCQGLILEVQGLQIQQDFFVFSLGGADIVLGLEWLASLGEVRADFGNLRLSIGKGLQEHVLRGDPTLSRSESSLKSLWQDFKQQGTCFVIKWEEITHSGTVPVPPQVLSILAANEDIFQAIEGLPPSREHDHSIHLQEGAAIPSLRPYKLIQEMLQAGVIRPSISPYSSPIILVKKKDGGWRFCVDYRALKRVTIPNKFPIPMIEELLDELASATMFSKLDLKSGDQILMRQEDIEKTAFRTHEGHYEFLVMPFGLTNALATFQALMNRILQPCLQKLVLVFFDDILIYSPNLATHVTQLTEVFKVLQQHKLKLNKKKCVFGQLQLEYLGHIISQQGVAADPQKVEAMEKWPVPRNPKALRGFLGFTGYYRRFTQQAFEELKKVVSQLPVLAIPDFSKSFTLETDASSKGLGLQALSERGQQKFVYERELMAIVQAVKKWKHYLMGSHFIILTDQKSLKFLTDQRLLTEEQFKWASKLLGFDFEIRFRPGKDNQVADVLSHRDCFKAISILQPEQWASWEEESQQDAGLMALIQDLLLDPSSHEGYDLRKGRLFYKGKLVSSKNSSTLSTIIKEMHESPTGGHSGYFRTFKRIAGVLYWEGMKKDIKEWVQHCEVCQRNKAETLAPAGLLQPLPIPTQVWSDISMDFIGGLPKVQGKDTILVVVDRLTKYAHFLALAHPFTTTEVAQLFIKEIVKLHGFSTAYHPQSDGQTEVVNRCLETYLRCMTSTHPRKWPQWLSWVEFWFNTNYSSSTKMSPFKALYGRDPPLLLKGSTIPSKVQSVNQLQQERDEILRELKDDLCKAQEQNKKQANKHRREVEFQVGDWVYLKLQPYRLKSLAKRPNEKLRPRFYGPYVVQERIGPVAYKLDLPAHSRIHPVFHVSLLKRAVQPTTSVQSLPPTLTEELMLEVSPEELLDVRTSPTGDLEVLIKWQHLPSIENIWESAAAINMEFPAFHLEDKVTLHGGGIDRYIGKVYSRRKTA
ncbi:hypothetical protein V8G54_023558 [Vigna mungo]|uniref:RNA-directed DNA polymerase n=1 Tax=Vigna mungo TaxID=3915 RepID=A0AAQ3N5B2_VIGMU